MSKHTRSKAAQLAKLINTFTSWRRSSDPLISVPSIGNNVFIRIRTNFSFKRNDKSFTDKLKCRRHSLEPVSIEILWNKLASQYLNDHIQVTCHLIYGIVYTNNQNMFIIKWINNDLVYLCHRSTRVMYKSKMCRVNIWRSFDNYL